MTPRCPVYVVKHHHSVIAAIGREPGNELVHVRRSDLWQDGWRCSIYRGQGMDADPVLVAVADKLPSPLEAFEAALARMRAAAAA